MGTWETDPFLGDNKVTRFYDEWRDDEWYTTAATLKGDLGFAELSLTGVLLRPQDRLPVGQHQLRPVASYYYRTTRDYALYDTGTLHSTTFNFQKQNR